MKRMIMSQPNRRSPVNPADPSTTMSIGAGIASKHSLSVGHVCIELFMSSGSIQVLVYTSQPACFQTAESYIRDSSTPTGAMSSAGAGIHSA